MQARTCGGAPARANAKILLSPKGEKRLALSGLRHAAEACRWSGRQILSRPIDARSGPDHDLDLFDDVAFENLIHDLDSVQDLREDGVLVIEARVVDEVDEQLRVAGVAPARRDADRAADVRPQSDFV